MTKHDAIVPERIRNIRQCTFGWVDHNFLHRGFVGRLSKEELLLYYFLITVADKSGVSFYDYARICQLLKLEVDDYVHARNLLCERSLLAFDNGVFQVLPLPPCLEAIRATPPRRSPEGDFHTLKEILERVPCHS